MQKKQDSLIDKYAPSGELNFRRIEKFPVAISFCLILVTVFSVSLVLLFATLTTELEEQMYRLETRIEHLEDRVGSNAVARGKTGMNRVWHLTRKE